MLSRLLRPEVLIFMIPIVAIVCSCVHRITKMKLEHEERLARIEAGLDPEFALEEDYA